MERAHKVPDRSTQYQPLARSASGASTASALVDRSAKGAKLSALAQMMQISPQVTAQLALKAQLAAAATQRVAAEEEEWLQGKFETTQRVDADEEELLQGKFAPSQRVAAESAPRPNQTGLPDGLKAGVEALSGISLDQVRVHYNSARPAQLNAHAYAQGSDIHLAPGQQQHLPHEAWHVVQQAQGRVKPTMQRKEGVPVNDDAGLEHEADVMGARAASAGNLSGPSGMFQRQAESADGQTNVTTVQQYRSDMNSIKLRELVDRVLTDRAFVLELAKKGISGFYDAFFEFDAVEDLFDSKKGGRASFLVVEPGFKLQQIELHPGGGIHESAYIGLKTSKGTVKLIYGDPESFKPLGESNVTHEFVGGECPFGAYGVTFGGYDD